MADNSVEGERKKRRKGTKEAERKRVRRKGSEILTFVHRPLYQLKGNDVILAFSNSKVLAPKGLAG